MIINPYIFTSLLPKTAALVTAADLTNTTYITAVNTFEQALINASIADSDIERMYLSVNDKATNSDRATQNSFNFMNTATKQLTWTGGVTQLQTGYTGNGSNGYGYGTSVDSGIVGLNDIAIHFYSRTNQVRDNYELGAFVGGSYLSINPRFDVTGHTQVGTNDGTNWASMPLLADTLGLITANRPNSNTSQLYKRGVYLGAVTINSIVLASSNFNVGGFAGSSSTKEQCFVAVTKSLDATKQLAFYNAVQALQTSLSRNV